MSNPEHGDDRRARLLAAARVTDDATLRVGAHEAATIRDSAAARGDDHVAGFFALLVEVAHTALDERRVLAREVDAATSPVTVLWAGLLPE